MLLASTEMTAAKLRSALQAQKEDMIALVVLDLPHSALVEHEAHLPHPILDKKEDTRPCNSSLTILKPVFWDHH